MPGGPIPKWGGKEEPFNLLMRLLCLLKPAWAAHMVGPLRLPASLWPAEPVVLCSPGYFNRDCGRPWAFLLRKFTFSPQMPPPVRAAVVSAVPVMPRPPMTSVVRLPPGSVIATPMPPIIHTPRINVVPMPPSAPPIMSPRPPPMIVPTGQ